ncbi:MAG: hypothetical protein H7210_07800 [Pyrinomonadaceae bacterium]|nr:hypothetical protein [Phycisphaerales bacterium]
MLIIHGTKIRRKPRGQTTAFCVICRMPQQLDVCGVRRVSHVYFIPIGRGRHVSDEARCGQCGTLFGAAREIRINSFQTDDVDSAMEQLPPEVVDELLGHMDREDRITGGQLTTEERAPLILEPFEVLEYQFKHKAKSGGRESLTAMAVVLWLFTTLAAVILWWEALAPHKPVASLMAWAIGCSVVAAGSLAYAVYLIVTRGRHAASGEIADRLALSLAPLRPTEMELVEAIRVLRASKSGLARSVRVEELMRRLGQ